MIIKKKEVLSQIKKLKMRRAPGREVTQNEAWKYGLERMTERLVQIMNEVCVARKAPRQGMEGVITLITRKM